MPWGVCYDFRLRSVGVPALRPMRSSYANGDEHPPNNGDEV